MNKYLFCLSLCVINLFIGQSASAYLQETETPLVEYLKPVEVTNFDSGVPFINCIYVINIDYRKDKWERLLPMFEKMNVRVNRMSAVIGKDLTDADKQAMFGDSPVTLSGPEIGCLLSHISIIKDAKERNFDVIWICEDDLEFNEPVDILPGYIKKLNEIDPEWDILYTDTNCRDPYDWYYYPLSTNPRPGQHLPSFHFMNKRTPVAEGLERIRIRYGTTSMVISKSGIKKILNYFSHIYLWVPYDWDLHYIPRIKEYGITRDAITNLRQGIAGDIHWIPH